MIAEKGQIAMAYLKPPALTRKVLNPLMMRSGLGGTVTLTVPGRRTGMPRKVPVIPVELAGSRYLVSPYGETEWCATCVRLAAAN